MNWILKSVTVHLLKVSARMVVYVAAILAEDSIAIVLKSRMGRFAKFEPETLEGGHT